MTVLRVPEDLTEPGYRDGWARRSDLPLAAVLRGAVPDGAIHRESDDALAAARRYRDLLHAHATALRALMGHGAAFDADPDPATAEARFRAHAKDLRAEWGARLGAGTRPLFERDFDRIAEPFAVAVGQAARAREIADVGNALEARQDALQALAEGAPNAVLKAEAERQHAQERERAAHLGVIADAGTIRRA